MLFLDCEFNHPTKELISLALYRNENDFFYYALKTSNKNIDPWVAKNVLPVLNTVPVGIDEFQSALQGFLSTRKNDKIVADWHSDIEYFCRALEKSPGEAIDFKRIEFLIDRSLNTNKSKIPHNALADAKALKEMADEKYGILRWESNNF